jgi:YD repeat-containing protein
MKTIIKRYPLLSKRNIIAIVFVTIVFSCSKKTGDPSNIAVKYCSNIDWSNTIGLSGYFQGVINAGTWNLGAANLTENATDNLVVFHRTNGTNQILNDLAGWTFTYNQTNLVKIVMGDATGTIAFTFDTNGHLTNTDIENSDETGTLSLKFNYTYDSNDDPVKIVAHAINNTSSGTSTSDYDITADYLTDKPNFMPLVPEIAPFSIYYAYSYYLSRHLINRWVIKINTTTEQGVALPTVNFTQQYTYTYDAHGNVATMVHTGNSNNIFTFTYSGCN